MTYIAQDRPDAAMSMVKRIQAAVSKLAPQPALGRPGRVTGTRELVVAGTPYIIPYRVRENTVEILRVFHGARRWPESFEGGG
jgi:toxin ParE1/3/4